MSKPIYIFYYKDIVSGGAEYLILRMAIHFIRAGYDIAVLCQSISREMLAEFKKSHVPTVYIIKNIQMASQLVFKQSEAHDVRVMVLTLRDYLCLYRPSQRIKYILYIVHKNALVQSWLRPGLVREIVSKELLLHICSDHIAFMDEFACRNSAKFLHINHKYLYTNLIRLPFVCNDKMIHAVHSRSSDGVFHVLSVSRADFPFKAYLFGLIDVCEQLKRAGLNLELTVISHGKGIADLKTKAAESDCVTLLNGMSNDSLIDYYRSAQLYVGMGTTLIEAANQGVPSIAVRSYTSKFEAESMFAESGGMLECESGSQQKGIELIKKVYEMDEERYRNLCMDTLHTCQSHYGIDAIMDKFESMYASQVFQKRSVFLAMYSKILMILANK